MNNANNTIKKLVDGVTFDLGCTPRDIQVAVRHLENEHARFWAMAQDDTSVRFAEDSAFATVAGAMDRLVDAILEPTGGYVGGLQVGNR